MPSRVGADVPEIGQTAGGDAKINPAENRRSFSIYEKLLLLLFFATLPLMNPWVRGDGVGYYAYARALLIEHRLAFENDWLAANPTFRMGRLDREGHLKADQYTPTGHLDNHFAVGPAILWAPFLIVVHLIVLAANHLGAHIAANGFSRPYLITMALATATYGFAGLFLAFRLARKYFHECWAFLATLGIWFGSSLPVYMYFNPSWSHAHSAFVVALFLWYWHRTRAERTVSQWVLLGLISGLMINVYYPNGLLLLVPGLEALAAYARCWPRSDGWTNMKRLFAAHFLYGFVVLIALLPTFITRLVIYGNASQFGRGYTETNDWFWTHPAAIQVLFSANHGLFSWTPILILAVAGLSAFLKRDQAFAAYLLAVFFAFYYVIASFYFWHGLSSYGNRFFVSLTVLFILGLAASLESLARFFAGRRKAFAVASVIVGLFVVWNAGLIFQWGTHMIPVRGPISWREMAHNQVAVVPERVAGALKAYLTGRHAMMRRIEEKDIEQIQSATPENP